ncbi:hypothetical protein MNB_SV-5-180 [hydrothermal vent metagenome]|uniref:Uncharacterized protein n=1 Tax=hydrothermal vent metagenome TaxID=652676 RepID=A0A1W1ECL7_9ZZZZ
MILNAATKELEFTNTTFTEVDTNNTVGIAYGTYGVRDNGVLTMKNFRYYSDSIKLLRSKTATYIGDKIYLDVNVILNKELGSDYYTEHAIYDKKEEILDITAPYKAYMGQNIMYGDTLRYWAKSKKAFSTNVDAILYTKEK